MADPRNMRTWVRCPAGHEIRLDMSHRRGKVPVFFHCRHCRRSYPFVAWLDGSTDVSQSTRAPAAEDSGHGVKPARAYHRADPVQPPASPAPIPTADAHGPGRQIMPDRRRVLDVLKGARR